jgi:hypothetical protein
MATAPQAAMDMPPEAANPYANPDTAAIYDQMRQTVSPKEFSDEMLAGASQTGPEEVAAFRAALEQVEMPPEALDMLNDMVDEILANPEKYDEIRARFKEMGAPDEILPEQFDPQFFAALNMAVDQMIAEPAGVQAFAKGGIAELKPVAKAIAAYGRNGDTMLAHITPAEARMLRRRGGSGTINPKTGLPEFFLKKLFKGVSNALKAVGNAVKDFASSTVGKVVTTVALGFFLGPAAASLVGATSAAGVAAVSGFVGSAGSTLLGGGNLKDALKAGAIGGLTAGAGAGVMGGSEALQAGSYTGPTTVGGQVDKFTGMFKSPPFPEYAAQAPSGVQAPAIDATGQVKGLAPVETLDTTGPKTWSDQTWADQPAVERAAPKFIETPPNANEQVFTPKKVSLVPDGQGGLKFPEGQTVGQTTLPGGQILTQNVPIADATQFPGSFDKTGVSPPIGMGPTEPPSFLDRAKTFYNENISPSGIQQQGIPDAQKAAAKAVTDLTARLPDATAAMKEAAYQNAYKAAMPGILSTYGPMAAAGIGALAVSGGFKPTSAAPSTLRPELMKPVTQRIAEGGNQRAFYVQGLPGVKYDQYGAPIFGQNVPLPTFETGLGVTAMMNPKGYADGGSIAVGYAGGGLTGVSDVAKRVVDANNFDSTAYLNANPDVKAAIAKGEIADAYSHYTKYGQAEGRTAFDKAETAATAAKTAEEKAAAQAANRKAVADAKAAKKAAGFTNAYQNINAGLSYDVPAGIAATAIAARQAAFKPTMDKFTQAQATNAATLAKPYTPTVVDQPYNTKGYENVFNPITTPVNYDTTPVGLTAEQIAAKAAADKAAADAAAKAAADKAAADKAAADAAAAATTTVQPPVTTGYTGRPITDQEVMDWLKANPTANDRRIAQEMQKFNVGTEQVARATGMQGLANSSPQSVQSRYDRATSNNPFDIGASDQAEAITGADIRGWLDQNKGASDAQIAAAMDKYRVNFGQMSAALAGTPDALSGQDIMARYIAAQKLPAAGGGQTFIPDPRLPEGMMGTMGGSGYDPVTGRVDLGTAGGSGQYVPRAEEPKKLLNMGGIASLSSGGYPRRTGQISGPGTATSDSIPAMLSDGEFVMTAKAVRGAGKGDKRAGAKRMYALMNQLEKNAARG